MVYPLLSLCDARLILCDQLACSLGESAECPRNSHGVPHKRSLPQTITPVIPDLRSNLSMSAPGFTGIFLFAIIITNS